MQDSQLGLNGVLHREVPLYVHNWLVGIIVSLDTLYR